jgi:hypothetical protein
MADTKNTLDPVFDPTAEVSADTSLGVEATRAAAPTFEPDSFLAGKTSDTKKQETQKSVAPQIVKRGGVGFITAFLMSSVAAGAGAYLALLAGSRPDLLQKAGIAAFVPAPPAAPSLGTSANNIQPLVARIAAVEGELLALKTRLEGTNPAGALPAGPLPPGSGIANSAPPAPTDGTTPTPATPVVPAPVVSADTGAMKSELQGMSGRLTAIETRLAALDPTGAGGAIVAGLQADIAGLKAIVTTLQQQAATAPSPAATFAVVNLAEAANRSGPFMIEYETVRAAMPGVPEVAALEPFARTGVPTRQLLQERFATLQSAEAAEAAAIAASQKETGIVAWIRSLMSDMVKVQPAPTVNGTGSTAVLTRAKAKLDQGDLAGCVSEMATIPKPSTAVTEWTDSARKRLDLESRISAVRGAVGRAPATPALAPPAAPIANSNVPSATPPLPPPPAPVPAIKTQGTNP